MPDDLASAKRETEYYRRYCNELGASLFRLQEEQSQAFRSARRSRTVVKLLREAYRLGDAAMSTHDVGGPMLELLVENTLCDRAMLLREEAIGSGVFLVAQAIGLESKAASVPIVVPIPPDFLYTTAAQTMPSASAAAVVAGMGVAFVLWAYDASTGHGLVIGNSLETNLSRAFEAADQELIEAALSIYLDVIHRKTADVQLRQAKQAAESLAYFDPLTRLANRRLLLERLAEVTQDRRRAQRHGGVLFVDLDNFKLLNDTRGHAIGDLLLVEVARRLASCVRDVDLVARLGGDEFVVLVTELPAGAGAAAAEVGRIGERIVSTIDQPCFLGEQVFQTTSSIGISLFLGGEETVEQILQRADIAMYGAKSNGRNQYAFFDPAMQLIQQRRLTLATELRAALIGEEFLLHLQPQVDRNGRILGAEALIRWQRPGEALRMPDQFLSYAAETGLIEAIDIWVLRQARQVLQAWAADTTLRTLRLAINISARQLRNPCFVSQVRTLVGDVGLPLGGLTFEITEHVMLEEPLQAAARMRELRSLGVRFAIDDFGTGFSSLSRLRDLPIDEIKIDGTFVRDLVDEGADRTLVRAMIAMARGLNVGVVAEGVETETQFNILVAEGCREFQGYRFGQPMPLDQLVQHVKETRHAWAS